MALRTTRACDALLDWCVLALAVWTLAYHACLLLGAGTGWALGALGAAVVPCALVARGRGNRVAPAAGAGASGGAATATATAAALAAAGVIAFSGWPWPAMWAAWLAAAVAVVLASSRTPAVVSRAARLGAPAALAWAAALATLSLFLVRPNVDDAYYLRQATWIAEHGRFPLRDTLHSHDVLPAVFSPPLPSYEPLLGAVAGAAGVSAPGLAFLLAGPAVCALAVLALWRLLRTWEVRLPGAALTVAVVFLLTDVLPDGDPHAAIGHRAGDFFVSRAWQGKVVLAAALVPLLIALLHEHAARPRRRTLVLLAAAGAAAVGLSTTASFLVPVVAVAYLAPAAPRAPLPAAAGVAAATAYPAAAMAAALLSDARQPAVWTPRDIAPEALVLPAVGVGLFGFLAMSAALAGPLLLGPRCARRGTAAAALVTALCFAPGVPALIFELTGLGRPLWRLVWTMPIAALLGVVATQPAAGHRLAAVRLLGALSVCTLLAVAGTPVWHGRNTRLADRPSWKRPPGQLAAARALSAAAAPGDRVLAPEGLSQTLLMIDGRVTAVAPRYFYTRSLPATPESRRLERLRLWSFVRRGLRPDVRGDRIAAALRATGADIACVRAQAARSRAVLLGAGYRPLLRSHGYWCSVSAGRSRARSHGARARRACGSGARRPRCRSGRRARADGS